MATVIDTPEGIAYFQLAALREAVGLECKGMKRSRGPSATSIAKQSYRLKGNKTSIYQQLCQMVDAAKAKLN